MGSFSLMHWAIVLLLVLLLFGAGKLPKVMGDLAKGVKSFKAGLKDDESDAAPVLVTPVHGGASRKPAADA
ncbi:sec-independent protein translocase protein TatA [Azospirillum brasilense]|uniref:Sec-independent protein translocase protein TatA n=1 Tax=Azospirillum brasilense TaxID=192 RepID=A0A560CE96_AZOBR|nr:twin-arginine translocase TatA/TatE family subunit [Azospirillum brasilense]TWA83181.1 sec-independent protein translocase protein TatA [Azospirillum brasilense]